MARQVDKYVEFANFATSYGIAPRDVANLMVLARRAYAAGVIECNTGRNAGPARERFEKAASALGHKTEWNGLSPTLVKDGRDVYLPAM